MLGDLIQTLRLGYKSLLLHKLRSGLAMLGILIGSMAVIWLVALGEGVSYQAQQQIKELGATNVIIKSAKPPQSSSKSSAGAAVVEYGLTRDDYERIVNTIPTIQRAVPMRETRAEARSGGRLTEVSVIGCTPIYYDINHLHMDRGRFLSDRDLDQDDNVVVIASETARVLFPYQDPIGKKIQLLYNNTSDVYVIIGQTLSRAPSAAIGGSLEGRDYNLDIYIPISTFRSRIGDQIIRIISGGREGERLELNQITLTVGTIEQVQEAADIVRILLQKFHDVPDYSVTIPMELLKQAETLRMMFNALLVLIAGISLLVGGIGIMNIMLATVTERTREIGVRRALGARQADIIRQFLIEAMVISAAGGVIGVAFGFLCKPAISLTRAAIEYAQPELWAMLPASIQNLEPIYALWSVCAAFGISVVVGVLSGIYPAIRAAKMDPIEALRHE